MASTLDTVSAQLEVVSPLVTDVYETSDQISALVKRNSKNVSMLSRYLYRFVLEQFAGGTNAKYSANEGVLPKGTGMKLTSLQAGYFYSMLMFRVTDEQVDESQSSKQSVVDVMSRTLSSGMDNAAVMDDIAFHNDGTGKLTGLSSATTSTTMTFAGATDTLGVSRLREGLTVDVWDATGANKRVITTLADGPLRILTINYNTKVVTLNTAVTAITDTDILAFTGMDSYGPSTLTSFSSGWPATSALTTTGGLTNDSYRHGLYYANNFTDSNYYLGKQKSALPQIAPTEIPANSQPLSWAHGFALIDAIQKRRSMGEAEKLTWIFPLSQRYVVFDAGVALSTKMVTGNQFGKNYDPAPSNNQYNDPFNYVNCQAYVSKRQYNDRVDAINLKKWGRAEVFPGTRPYSKGGKTVFEGHDSSGLLAAYSEFGFQSAYDFVCYDPGCQGAVTGLAVPANY